MSENIFLWANPTEADNQNYYSYGQMPSNLQVFVDQHRNKVFNGYFEQNFQVLVEIKMNLNQEIVGLEIRDDFLTSFEKANLGGKNLILERGKFCSFNKSIWSIIFAIDDAKAKVLEFVLANLDTKTTIEWLKSVYFASKHQNLSKLKVKNKELALIDDFEMLEKIFEKQKTSKGMDIFTFLDKMDEAFVKMYEQEVIKILKEL